MKGPLKEEMITEVIWKIQSATCSSEIVVNFSWQKQSQVYLGAPNVGFLQNMFKTLLGYPECL